MGNILGNVGAAPRFVSKENGDGLRGHVVAEPASSHERCEKKATKQVRKDVSATRPSAT